MPVSGLDADGAATRAVALERSGRVRFAGILVILIGAFNLIQGIAAAARSAIPASNAGSGSSAR